jgi:hypothetical protein
LIVFFTFNFKYLSQFRWPKIGDRKRAIFSRQSLAIAIQKNSASNFSCLPNLRSFCQG